MKASIVPAIVAGLFATTAVAQDVAPMNVSFEDGAVVNR